MGALLTLVTWALALGVVLLLGLPWTLGPKRAGNRRVSLARLRFSLWIGLAVAFLVILITNVVVPIRSPAAALVGATVVATSLVVLLALRPRLSLRVATARLPAILVSTLGVLVVVYLTIVAMGPVTNYDSGLYHIGAIRYSGDYATIPGLANVYQAFGYNNSQFPFAAAFTNGPWGIEGMRLANGFLILLAMVDLILRWWSKRRGRAAWVMLVSSAILAIPMIGLADYWVTSPTSDSAVFTLSIVAATYLVEVLVSHGRRARDSIAVVVVTSVLILTMRPTMALYALVLVMIAIAVLIKRRKLLTRSESLPLLFSVLIAGALVGTQIVRDRLLSGWLMYPLSVLPFDVPWRALDPVNTRLSTLGAARDPENYLAATEGWEWVGPWVSRLPSMWEVYAWAVLLLFVLLLIVIRRWQGQRGLWSGTLAAAMLPAGVAVLAWWALSPPSFRFIWGPMFVLLAIPAGWLLYGIAKRGVGARDISVGVTLVILVVIAGVTAFTLVFRVNWPAWTAEQAFTVGPLTLPYSFAPVKDAPVEDVEMPSGLVLLRPIESDQCWMTYPLCTPLIEAEVIPRGSLADYPTGIGDGFTYRR